MDNPTLTGLSLFSGIGGLDLGVERALGRLGYRWAPAAYVEREAYCVAVLEERISEGRLPFAPIWTDVSTFRGEELVGLVDCILGGFPCQDLSVAGKRAGIDGERSGLWGEFARIVQHVRPNLVFVENVGHTWRRWLPRVRRDLWLMGYASLPFLLRASEVAATHHRSRVFVLAYTVSERLWNQRGGWRRPPGEGASFTLKPSPNRRASRAPKGLGEPTVDRAGDGVPYRLDRLRALGNAVVPQQAERAFLELWSRIPH